MKINNLLETFTTPSTDPVGNQSQQAPKFGRDPEVLEDDKLDETSAGATGSTLSTGSGSVATVSQPLGNIQKRKGTGALFTGIKTSAKYPNSKTVKEEEIKEQDLIINPTLKRAPKPGFHKKDMLRLDHEVEMARSDLLAANKNSKKIYDLIKSRTEQDGLEGWVQEKIIKANDYLNSVAEYLENKQIDTRKGIDEMVIGEVADSQDIIDAIGYRIMKVRPDLVTKFGHEVVGDAILDVASSHEGLEELGSNDISIMVKEVIQQIEQRDMNETKNQLTAREKFNRSLKKSGYDPEAGANRLLNLLAKQKIEREKFEKELPSVYGDKDQDVTEAGSPAQQAAIAIAMKKAGKKPKNKTEGISVDQSLDQIEENLHKWFKEKWVRFGPDGKIKGPCARGDDSEGKPKCLPQSKAHSLGKKGRASAGARKRREDPNPERSGPAINVATKKKSNEGVAEGHEMCPECGGAMYSEEMINEKKDACYYKVKSRYKVWPSAYASGALVKCRNKGAKNWGNKSESVTEEQLDELKCWTGYTRVKGVPAGAPGSCKKKTKK